MRALVRFGYLLALALWVGGGAVYTFVLTPAIFGAYPRNQAGDIVGTLMPHYFAALLGATALAALCFLAVRRSWSPRARALSLALLLAALATQAYVQWRLYPEILAVKSRVATFESDPEAPARKRFRALHGTSMLLNLLVLADGAALLAVLSLQRRQGPAAG